MKSERQQQLENVREMLTVEGPCLNSQAIHQVMVGEGIGNREATSLIAEAMGLNLVESFVNSEGVRLIRAVPAPAEEPKPVEVLGIPDQTKPNQSFVFGVRPGLRVEVMAVDGLASVEAVEALASEGWVILTKSNCEFGFDPVVLARIES